MTFSLWDGILHRIIAMQHPEIGKRILSVKDAMQSEFAKHLVRFIGLKEIALSELIKSAVPRFEELGLFKEEGDLNNFDTVGYFLHILQAAKIVEEDGEAESIENGNIFSEPVLRLSETGRELYQEAGQKTG